MAINPTKERLTSIGKVIASRELFLADTPEQKYLVRIGEAVPFADAQDWYCPYEIVGPHFHKIFFAAGIDSFQAVELAQKGAAADVFALNQHLNGRLRAFANEPQLGFTAFDGEKF